MLFRHCQTVLFYIRFVPDTSSTFPLNPMGIHMWYPDHLHNRDADMVQYINEQNAAEGQEKAVSGGASFDRSKKPNLYRFTSDEVELYREAREERLQKVREDQEEQKNLTKKPKEQKRFFIKRKSREDKLKTYRDRLVQKGKETLARKQNKNVQEDISDDNEER